MSRAIVRKVFVTGLVVGVVGAVFLLLGMGGGRTPSSQLYNAGGALLAIGALITAVSWILALLSSAILGRWGWFVVLLVLGLIGLLLLAMIVYSIAGPTQRRDVRRGMVAT